MTNRTVTYTTLDGATLQGRPLFIRRDMVTIELARTRGTERKTLRQSEIVPVAPIRRAVAQAA